MEMETHAKPKLEDIVELVRRDTVARRKEKSMRQQMAAAARRKDYRDIGLALRRAPRQGLRWIGEIKRASPSAGILRPDLDPVALANLYAKKGAAAVSVLTEGNYFHGSLADLTQAHDQSPLPVLRKDFIVDEYQIVEAAASGADAILLIVALLSSKEIEVFLECAAENSLGCLVEVHNADELNKALDAGALILGINNRNLKTLEVDLSHTLQLFPSIPKGMIAVSESGYKTREELQKIEALGLDAVLIGETLMRSPDIEKAIDELFPPAVSS